MKNLLACIAGMINIAAHFSWLFMRREAFATTCYYPGAMMITGTALYGEAHKIDIATDLHFVIYFYD